MSATPRYCRRATMNGRAPDAVPAELPARAGSPSWQCGVRGVSRAVAGGVVRRAGSGGAVSRMVAPHIEVLDGPLVLMRLLSPGGSAPGRSPTAAGYPVPGYLAPGHRVHRMWRLRLRDANRVFLMVSRGTAAVLGEGLASSRYFVIPAHQVGRGDHG